MIIPNIWENKKCSKPPTRQSSNSLYYSIESWSVDRDSPFLDHSNPQYIKGSIIPHNHQPTGVLNTAQKNRNAWQLVAIGFIFFQSLCLPSQMLAKCRVETITFRNCSVQQQNSKRGRTAFHSMARGSSWTFYRLLSLDLHQQEWKHREWLTWQKLPSQHSADSLLLDSTIYISGSLVATMCTYPAICRKHYLHDKFLM